MEKKLDKTKKADDFDVRLWYKTTVQTEIDEGENVSYSKLYITGEGD